MVFFQHLNTSARLTVLPVSPNMSPFQHLQSLCQELATEAHQDLIRDLPELLCSVQRCGRILSTPHERKTKTSASGAQVLVHRLKTQISTFLGGKTPRERLVGVALAKAVIDVGERECLQMCGPWTRFLLSTLLVSTAIIFTGHPSLQKGRQQITHAR